MKKEEINKILEELNKTRDRNIIIVDFGNVQKWDKSLGWKIGIKELANLIKDFLRNSNFTPISRPNPTRNGLHRPTN